MSQGPITANDLPRIRREMCGHADNEDFSDSLRSICRQIVTAIDSVQGDTRAAYADVEKSFDAFVAAWPMELKRIERAKELLDRIPHLKDDQSIRQVLGELAPLLTTKWKLNLVVMLKRVGIEADKYDLVNLPAASDRLH
ncbi:protein of unknown function [Georgfuchsia toluolica]|uniref:Uncharacterized protein n=1 Tax=Georgfuchsia toluolica TaxID=424218 RepID=A0A916J4H4_9PROT|nr:hypothetical protein [Georgfuchsia toluolica]CAG4883802.1 protein of unknown function [Georgfuchsia toluolica]